MKYRSERQKQKIQKLSEQNARLQARIRQLEEEMSRLESVIERNKDIGSSFDKIYSEYKSAIHEAKEARDNYEAVLADLLILKKGYSKDMRKLLASIN